MKICSDIRSREMPVSPNFIKSIEKMQEITRIINNH